MRVIVTAPDANPQPQVSAIILKPETASLPTGATQEFDATAKYADGSTASADVTYDATGGSIAADGIYTAGDREGSYHVIATQARGTLADTALVRITAASVPEPTVEAIVLTPATVTLPTEGRRTFTATAELSDGTTVPADAVFEATGGTVAEDGVYTAGNTPGVFKVIAKSASKPLADTAAVTVTQPEQPPPPVATDCPATGYLRLVHVSTQGELVAAVSAALPGDRIQMAPGRYVGGINPSRDGTSARPITLCGSRSAVIVNPSGWSSIRADWWIYSGFTVTGGLTGLYAIDANHNVFDGLLIEQVGQAALALGGPAGSSYNRVTRTTIRQTGTLHAVYGEGIYVGDGKTGASPSNHNQIIGNVIGPGVTAEHVDVKAGAVGTLVKDNVSDATGVIPVNMHVNGTYTDNGSSATQWSNNRITGMNNALLRGFYFFRATGARVASNSVTGPRMRYGYEVVASTDIVLSCDNIGTTSFPCTQ